MKYRNTIKLRKDLSKISDPNPQLKMQKVIAWATYHTQRVEYIESIKGNAGQSYSSMVAEYDRNQPKRLWM